MVGLGHLPSAAARVAGMPSVGAVTGCTGALAEHANRLPKHDALGEFARFPHRPTLYRDGSEASGNATHPSLPSRRLLPPCCWLLGRVLRPVPGPLFLCLVWGSVGGVRIAAAALVWGLAGVG